MDRLRNNCADAFLGIVLNQGIRFKSNKKKAWIKKNVC
jgi:hypothetical protein